MAKERFRKKLLVEGKDDQHVIWALCAKFNVPENFDIVDCDGIENLIIQIPVRLKSPVDTIAIIVDADIGISNRWKSLSGILNNKGFSCPGMIPLEGFITQNDEKRIGIWIMPNNALNGMIEDFVAFLVPKDDQLLPIANETLENIELRGLNKYLPIHKPKALIHTWLAWQADPGTPMGQAITKRYLTTDDENCIRFIDWLKLTFE